MTAAATGIGSMPGIEMAEALRVVTRELPDNVFLPELPARGAQANMIGRATAMLEGLAVDLQPAGWRLTDASGIDHRRAISMLARDLDLLEEHTQGYDGRLKIQVAGPWTLAATMERPRGDKVLADHGARREVAQSLAAGLRTHIQDVSSRVPDAQILVQLDEPALPSVLAGSIPTASGFHRHRSVDDPRAVEALAWVIDAVIAGGALPVVHVCAADAPVRTLVAAGAEAISFDLSTVRASDGDLWAQVFESGVDLWPGVVPSTEPAAPPTDTELVVRVDRFCSLLGFELDGMEDRVVITPTCGLAGASPAWARQALALARATAASIGQ